MGAMKSLSRRFKLETQEHIRLFQRMILERQTVLLRSVSKVSILKPLRSFYLVGCLIAVR